METNTTSPLPLEFFSVHFLCVSYPSHETLHSTNFQREETFFQLSASQRRGQENRTYCVGTPV